MMRKHSDINRDEINEDFIARAQPGLKYCQRVGNIMGATIMVSLVSAIENGVFDAPQRIGCFSYGSGCCSEFYSGVASASGQKKLASMLIARQLDTRHGLTMDEYETILNGSHAVKFGTRNVLLDLNLIPTVLDSIKSNVVATGRKRIFLKEIKEFYRNYEWV
jgi:polyketide biosynthesis 3-hydroxy-3-methylglutaryl-CoA synthase-like enzyme PksG